MRDEQFQSGTDPQVIETTTGSTATTLETAREAHRLGYSSPLIQADDSRKSQRDYLKTLFSDLHGFIDLRFISPDGRTQRFPVDGVESTLTAIKEHGEGKNVYVGIATRKTAGTERGDGGKENLSAVSALWVDLDFRQDGDREAFEAKLQSFPCPPSMRVGSGHGEHPYWLLDEPFDLTTEAARDRFERVLQGLAEHFGADSKATDSSRVLRVPGTVNHPDAKKRAKGFGETPCQLLVPDTGKRYSIDAFEAFEGRGRSIADVSESTGTADVKKLPGPAYRRLVDALRESGCKQSNGGKSWSCPAHDDSNPSLSVNQGEECVLIYCQTGCETQAVVEALGLKMADLFDRTLSRDRSTPPKPVAKPNGLASIVPSERVAVYDYKSEIGDILRRKVRLEPKSFVWEKPVDSGWQKCEGDGNPGVLYALPLVLDAEVIHVCEGEKAVDALNAYFEEHELSDHAATCPPTSKWEALYTEALRKKSTILWVDRDETGIKKAQTIYTELVAAGIPVEGVQSKVLTEGADAFDHLEAGFSPDDGQPLELQLDAEQQERAEIASRFSEDKTNIDFIFGRSPGPREFLISDFLPAHESGLLVARGGTGKGYLQLALTLSLALGEPFGPFVTLKKRGVVLVSVEDDKEEFHRRITAALDVHYWGRSKYWRAELPEELPKYIRHVDLRGITKPHLGPELREHIARTVELVDDPGLVLLDPLGRLAPPGIQINSQEGAALIINELDAIRQTTGVSTLAAYHVTKQALREGGELRSGASSGSLQLEDLTRWVLNLKALNSKEASSYGLETEGTHYVEAAVTKTNYTRLPSSPLVWQRCKGGALKYVKARSAAEIDESHALNVLCEAGYWMTREDWEEQANEEHDLAKNRAKSARERLVKAGRVTKHTVREGRNSKCVFAPSDEARRLMNWPEPPGKLAEIKA